MPRKQGALCAEKGQRSGNTNGAVQERNSAVTKNSFCQTLNLCIQDQEGSFFLRVGRLCHSESMGRSPKVAEKGKGSKFTFMHK